MILGGTPMSGTLQIVTTDPSNDPSNDPDPTILLVSRLPRCYLLEDLDDVGQNEMLQPQCRVALDGPK